MTTYSPEEKQCVAFVRWCRTHSIECYHIRNELKPQSKKVTKQQILAIAKKDKAIGVRRGIFDYELHVPIFDCDDNIVASFEVKIEMKRKKEDGKKGVESKYQKEYGKILDRSGIMHATCNGCEEAIDAVCGFAKEISEKTYEYLTKEEF